MVRCHTKLNENLWIFLNVCEKALVVAVVFVNLFGSLLHHHFPHMKWQSHNQATKFKIKLVINYHF